MKLLERIVGFGPKALIVALGLVGATSSPGAVAQFTPASVVIDATQPGAAIDGNLWGSNLLQSTSAATTVEDPAFVDAARQMGLSLIRWPGGNNADTYDWKRDEVIKPGGRVHYKDRVDAARLLQFVTDLGAEAIITVNFGTMTARDAADLVEFLNGPADSTWGAYRAGLGFPAPVGVRFFEIGNEENQPHMWFYSWTAESPQKYFFGGDQERRGFYGGSLHDPVGAKGDFFQAKGGPSQAYPLRFPPVRDVRTFWAANREDAENRVFEEWLPVPELASQPPDARVFSVDPATGLLSFGDGTHGAAPPGGSYFLVEYTTHDREGFLDFARAMRGVASSVPILIGAATLPFAGSQPIGDDETMARVFGAMDFYVRHQYNASSPYDTYGFRRQIAAARVDNLTQGKLPSYLASIGVTKSLGIGVTEWNIFLDPDYWHINRTLEGGVIAAEWLVRLLNAQPDAPVLDATQFALHGGALALIRTQGNGSVAPMGYVLEGFTPWTGSRVLPTTVSSPGAVAYDKEIPLVAATAALSADGRTLRAALVNNAEDTAVATDLVVSGFAPTAARLWRLAGESAAADNERDPDHVVLLEAPVSAPLGTLTLPPHSVTFVALAAPSGPPCALGAGDAAGQRWPPSVAPDADSACRIYLPSASGGGQPQPPEPATVTLRSDVSEPGSPLPDLLKPNADLHPMWGGFLDDQIAAWSRDVGRWEEGTYFVKLSLTAVEEGGIDLVNGSYVQALATRRRGANVFVEIYQVPPSLQRPGSCTEPRDEGECAPTSYEGFRDVVETLVTYLSVHDVVMPDSEAARILHIEGAPSLGLDDLFFVFWHEANGVGWQDGAASWFKLYDYWIEAVRRVRAAYPSADFKVGTELQGDNLITSRAGWQQDHEDVLNYLNLFLPFLAGVPGKDFADYQYRSEPPLDLDFYAFNPRNNMNDHWIRDWPDGFYGAIQDVFGQHGFGEMTYVAWALESDHLQVSAPLLPAPPPEKPVVRYWGAERDSEMGAVAQLALQYDAERSPIIDLSYSWGEWLRDPLYCYGVNRDVVPTEYPLYRGCEGNGFTFGGYAKATYNIMRMLGMQEKLRVPVQITYGGSARIRNRVGAVVTRDQSGERVVVLVWYYIAPDSLRNAAGLRYEDLRAYGNENLRGNVEIVLDGLGPGTRHVEGYVVDETRSNGFHYRQAIADAKAPADEANTWLADNNPFAASVALERVESRDAVRTEAGRLSLRYEGVAPWTAMLIEVRSEGRSTVRGEWPRPATAD